MRHSWIARIATGMLALVIALGMTIRLTAAERDMERGNYFAQHAGPASGQSGVDPYDPYAPVDLTAMGSQERTAIRFGAPPRQTLQQALTRSVDEDHCLPTTCRAW